jgi:hypothetical protein
MFAHSAISSKQYFWFARFFEQKCEQKCEQTSFRQLFLLDVSKKSEQTRASKTIKIGPQGCCDAIKKIIRVVIIIYLAY